MKTILSILFLLISNLFSQIPLDTVESFYCGPGVKYTKYVNTQKPWSINVLSIDLKNPYIKIESHKGYDTLYGGLEKTSSISGRKNTINHFAVGGVNGDFFLYVPPGVPTNTQVINGEILKRESNNPLIAFTDNKMVSFQTASYFGVVYGKGQKDTIDNVNDVRNTNQLILFNSLFGKSTYTNEFGTELLVTPFNGVWYVNDTIYCRVDSVIKNKGNNLLTKGKAILSGHGSASLFLNNFSKNDTILIYQKLFNNINKIKEMMGGHPIIVVKDSLANLDLTDPFLTNRHPRTLAGINKDTTKLFLVTVDGRQVNSIGMNVFEMYDLMAKTLKCYYAINLDGGGSTTMVVRNNVMNSPSDAGGERAVGNALLVISTAPLGNVTRIEVKPKNNRVFFKEKIQLSLSAWDEYYNPITINTSNVNYSCKTSLGSITSAGLFTAASVADSGYIYATYSGITDSCFVVVKGIKKTNLYPKNAVTDKNRIVKFSYEIIDTDDISHIFVDQSVIWKSLNNNVGIIDQLGQFYGINEGVCGVTATAFNVTDTSFITVQLLYGIYTADSIETIDNWSVSQENLNPNELTLKLTNEKHSIGNYSLKLTYKFIFDTAKTGYIYLNHPVLVPGIPDSLSIDVLSDGQSHRLFIDVEDNTGKPVRLFYPGLLNNPNTFIPVKINTFMSSSFIFPMKIKRIVISPGTTKIHNQEYSGILYFDNLSIIYPKSMTNLKDVSVEEDKLIIVNNYPNPFNSETKIVYSINKKSLIYFRLYNVLGEVLSSKDLGLKEEGEHQFIFNGENLSSGIYFYEIISDFSKVIKKLMIIK